jgi:hypothetical protein
MDDVLLESPMGPRAHSLSSAAYGDHTRVQQPAKSHQLHVDTGAVSLAIRVDVLPLMLAN